MGACDPRARGASRGVRARARQIDVVREKQVADKDLHPASAKVLATVDHEWEGLERHGSYPEADLDNNVAEPAIRGPVVGHKKLLRISLDLGRHACERTWTITASRAGLNPLRFLHAYLECCATSGGRPPSGEALARFFSSAVPEADLATWSDLASGRTP